MKQICLIILGVFLFYISSAQEPTKKYGNKYDIYAYGGVSRIFCDVNTVNTTGMGGVGFGIRANNYLRVNFDVQFGQYKGGNKNDLGQYYMEFQNQYMSFNAMARVYPFLVPFNKVDALDRFYVAAGFGLHKNNVTAHSSNVVGVGYLNNNKDVDVFIPMEAGYSFPIYKWNLLPGNVYANNISVLLGFRYNLSFSDTWDGYNPQVTANQHNDASCNVFVGLAYSF